MCLRAARESRTGRDEVPKEKPDVAMAAIKQATPTAASHWRAAVRAIARAIPTLNLDGLSFHR